MKSSATPTATKFNLNKTVVTRFTKPAAARDGDGGYTTLITLTHLTTIFG